MWRKPQIGQPSPRARGPRQSGQRWRQPAPLSWRARDWTDARRPSQQQRDEQDRLAQQAQHRAQVHAAGEPTTTPQSAQEHAQGDERQTQDGETTGHPQTKAGHQEEQPPAGSGGALKPAAGAKPVGRGQ